MWSYLDFDVMPPSDFMDETWMEEQGIWFPEISLKPTKAEPGDKVTIVGTGFPVGAAVTELLFAGQAQDIPTGAQATTADEAGQFTLIFNIPSDTGLGFYMIEVEAEAEGLPPVFIAKPFEITSSTEASFDMLVNPDWIKGVEQGNSGTTQISIEATGQQAEVTLSVEGLPFGASAAFSPSDTITAPPGGKSSATLTITTSASTPPGKYPLSIKGVSGANERVANFGFGVVMPEAFAIPELTLDPEFAPAGYGDKKLKITFSGAGFPADEAVLLKFAGETIALPENFATDTNGSFDGVFQLPTGLDAGTYMAEVTAGGKKDVKPFTIKPAGSTFIIDPSPPFLPPILQGGSAKTTLTVTSVATTSSTVELSVDGLPDGVTATFSPSATVTASPGSSNSATVTIDVGLGVMPGPYPLSIIGISESETASVPFGFGVMPKIAEGEGHASITINPPGANSGSNITVAGAGFTNGAPITLTTAAEGAATPVDITPGSITVQNDGTWSCQITVPDVPRGIYVVKATDGTISAKTKFDVVSEGTDAITLDISPSFLKVIQGASNTVTLSFTSQNKFKDSIQFSTGYLPLGTSITFKDATGTDIGQYIGTRSGDAEIVTSPASVTPVPGETTTVTVLIETGAETPLGPYTIPLEAKYSETVSEPLNLVVVSDAANLMITPNAGAGDTDVSLAGSGFTSGESITVTFGGDSITTVPSSITAAADGTFTFMLTILAANPGIYQIIATGESSATEAEAVFKVNPANADTFILSAKPAQISVPQGETGIFNLHVEPSGGFNSEVSLSLSGLDAVSADATAAFIPSSGKVTPAIGTVASTNLQITIPSDTEEGDYLLTVSGTGGDITQTVDLNLKVIPVHHRADFSISAAPSSLNIAAGGSATTTISVTSLNAFYDTVDLSVALSNSDAQWPAGVSHDANNAQVTPSTTTGTGSQAITFSIDAGVEPNSWAITITGTSGEKSHSTEITLVSTAAASDSTVVTSPLVDPTTVSKVTPLSVTNADGDTIQFNSIIPEIQAPLSVILEDIDTMPDTFGDIPVNWADARGSISNISTSAATSHINWQFTIGYDPDVLVANNIDATQLNLAYLDADTGEWVVEDTGITVRLTPSSQTITKDTNFTLDIGIEAGTQPISAAAVYLDYDTSKMEVVEIVANTAALGLELGSGYDNSNGRLNYSAGAELGGDPPTGTFTIATITFIGKADSASMPITFSTSGTRITDVSHSGGSVVGEMVDTANNITFANIQHMSAWTLLGSVTEKEVVMSLQPSADSIIFGSTFTVDIYLETFGHQVDSVAAYVNYDKDHLEVESITADESYLTEFDQSIDNDSGQLSYSATDTNFGGNGVAFNGNIATITFNYLGESEDTAITFNEESPRQTNVAYGGGTVSLVLVSCTVDQIYDAPLKLVPDELAGVVVEQEFDMELWVDGAQGEQVNGAAAYIDFDAVYLEVVSITADETYLTESDQSIDNISGELSYSGTADFGSPASGSFKIATIRFSAKAGVNSTDITLSVPGTGNPRNSTVTFGGSAIGGAHINASVSIIPAVPIVGKVILQGMGRPQAGYNVPLTIKLYDSSTEIKSANLLSETALDTFTTAEGDIIIDSIDLATRTITFLIADAPEGTYNITLYSPHSLLNLRNAVTLQAGGTLVMMGTLKEGDAKDSSENSLAIDITDFTRFALAYQTERGDEDWNASADFDRDENISIIDFSLLYMNYGQPSPQTVQ